MPQSNVLEIKDLTITFGRFEAVKKVSFTIQSGEVFGLLGPNGAGKSSTIHAITTLVKPQSGTIKLEGKPIKGVAKWAKKQIGFVSQELVNYAFFTVEEVMKIHAQFHGLSKAPAKIQYWLERLDLWDQRKKKAARLSGGMKRRLSIAKALSHQPKLLLLDEPSAGVDIGLREALWQLTEELKQSGTAILFTTHYLEEAQRLCDRVALIDEGIIKMERTTGELVQEAQKRIEIQLKEEVEAFEHSYLFDKKEKNLFFCMPNSIGLGHLIDSLPIKLSAIADIHVKEGTLEDVFRKELFS